MKFRVLLLFALMGVGLLSLSQRLPAWAQEHDMPGMDEDMRLLLHDVRAATVEYHDLDIALDAGYGKFLDCFRHGVDMGMGQHYVNGDLVGDDMLDPLQPEALVYEPSDDGTMTLVAYEYLVFADAWGEDREPPTLFGQEFNLKTNIPDTPPVWALHIWLWTHNPEGLYADYNPIVFCPEGEPSIDMSAS
jgi:hypothetical protein